MSRLNDYRKEKQKSITKSLEWLNEYRKNKEHWQKVTTFFSMNIFMGAYDYIQDFIQTDEYLV